MLVTLGVLGGLIVLFVQGKIRPDLVALTALIVLMVANILTPEEALSGFSNPIVVMMIGLFIVGGGILQTGLAQKISGKMAAISASSPWRVYVLVMVVTAFIGAFVSNTGTVALMLPIVVSLAASTRINSSRLLMPMAFASSLGGMFTLIGTPPNLVIHHALIDHGYEGLSFFSFAPIGLVVFTLGLVLIWPLSKLFLNKKSHSSTISDQRKGTSELVREYHLTENLHKVAVPSSSTLIGQAIKDLDIANAYNVVIVQVERKRDSYRPFTKPFRYSIASADTILEAGDQLQLTGQDEHILNFMEFFDLKLVDEVSGDASRQSEKEFNFEDIGVTEVVVLSNSRLVNQPVRNSGIRESYHLNILGIQRNNKYILKNLKDEVIKAGDALLIHGRWQDISRLNEHRTGLVVLGQPHVEAAKVPLNYKAPLAALIMLGMVLAMVFNVFAAVTAVMLAAILMVFSGCVRNVEAAYQTINWESVLLIGAMLPLSLALEKTGISQWVAVNLVTYFGDMRPIVLLGGIYMCTSVLTLFINNTATAVLFVPIAMQVSTTMNVSPYPFLFAVTVAASMCFASPFSTPPNALVMSAGRYTFRDYIKVGLPVQLIFAVVLTFVLPLLFPF